MHKQCFAVGGLQADCLVCSSEPQHLSFSENDKLQDIITYLIESAT